MPITVDTLMSPCTLCLMIVLNLKITDKTSKILSTFMLFATAIYAQNLVPFTMVAVLIGIRAAKMRHVPSWNM